MIKKFFNFKCFPKIRTISVIQKQLFCNIHRLNFDKLKIEKDKTFEDEVEEKFSIDDKIIEYINDTDWQETVLNSEIPVVVEVYAQ